MSRSVPWVSKPSPVVLDNISKVTQSRLFVLRENGPTGFLLKDINGKSFKVVVGNENKCSCKSHFTCVHILFVMIKVFSIPKENPLVYQNGFIDSEIDQILSAKGQPWILPKSTNQEAKKTNIKSRKIKKDDVCPICYEDIYPERRKRSLFTSCKCCGNNIHRKCMLIWCRHREKSHEDVTCPLCRNSWSSTEVSNLKRRVTVSRPPPSCSHCGERIRKHRNVYNCGMCSDFVLCRKCIFRRVHTYHPFRKRQKGGKWVNIDREEERRILRDQSFRRKQRFIELQTSNNNSNPASSFASPSYEDFSPSTLPLQPVLQYTESANNHLMGLQYRDISPEDYATLLDGLHDVQPTNELTQSILDSVIPNRDYDDISESCNSDCCTICLQKWEDKEEDEEEEDNDMNLMSQHSHHHQQQQLKILPFCGHVFHSKCVSRWVLEERPSCPICHTEVLPSRSQQQTGNISYSSSRRQSSPPPPPPRTDGNNNSSSNRRRRTRDVMNRRRRRRNNVVGEDERRRGQQQFTSILSIGGVNETSRRRNNNNNNKKKTSSLLLSRKKKKKSSPHVPDFHGFVLTGMKCDEDILTTSQQQQQQQQQTINSTYNNVHRLRAPRSAPSHQKRGNKNRLFEGVLMVTNHLSSSSSPSCNIRSNIPQQQQQQQHKKKKKSFLGRGGMIMKLKEQNRITQERMMESMKKKKKRSEKENNMRNLLHVENLESGRIISQSQQQQQRGKKKRGMRVSSTTTLLPSIRMKKKSFWKRDGVGVERVRSENGLQTRNINNNLELEGNRIRNRIIDL